MTNPWTTELVRLAVLALVALAIGAVMDATWLALCILLAVYLGWHLYHLFRLEHWLSREQRFAPPDADGIWGVVFGQYWQMRRRDRMRKRRLAELLRAVKQATTAMPDATVVLDRERSILWFNEAAEALLGLRAPQDYGRRIANLVRNPEFHRHLAVRSREPLEVPSPLDPTRWLQFHLVEYGDGQCLLLARDATRMRRLEMMRREFVANASHELRSPLTVIRGYLEALTDDPGVQAEWAPQLDEMRRQADRMAGIVDDLLELSRIETEAEAPGRGPVDVPGLIARIREEALALGQGPADITLDVSPGLLLAGDEREIHSAFSNLVFNAMRYTPADGSVTVRWYLDAGEPTLSVIDTGVGIAKEHLPRVTERFYRADPSRTRASGGTGLGLAIVKHVVQRHGGALRIDSQPGRGSTFSISFPRGRALARPERHGTVTSAR